MPCDGAAHECARADDSKITVEILDFRFACIGRAALDPVHGENSRFRRSLPRLKRRWNFKVVMFLL